MCRKIFLQGKTGGWNLWKTAKILNIFRKPLQLKRIYSIIKIVCVSTNGLLSDLKREVDTMVLLDELRVTMSDYQKDMDELYEVLGVAAATERYNVLQEEIAKEGFWDDLEHSQKVLQESKTLENRINSYYYAD